MKKFFIKHKKITYIITLSLLFCISMFLAYRISNPDIGEDILHALDQKILFSYTDDNTNEDLIIKSDKKNYDGFNNNIVYFNIKNTNRGAELIDLQVYFDNKQGDVENIEKWDKIEKQWISLSDQPFALVQEQDVYEEPTRIKKIFNFIARLWTREHDTPKSGLIVKKRTEYITESKETAYFRMAINYPPFSKGEFYIEAKGDKGGYGLLDPWYSSSWSYRKRINLNSSQISTTTDSFPVLATSTDADLASKARSDGYDIVFTDSDGETLLNYEREKFDSDTGEMVYWINTDISSTTDKVVYMYYGNASASDLATTTGVWDDNYVMVQHMQEDPSGDAPQIIDSTSNDNDGTSAGTMLTEDQVAGQVDGSLDFDGGNDYAYGTLQELYRQPKTISAWIKLDQVGVNTGVFSIGNTYNNSSPQTYLRIGVNNRLSSFGQYDATYDYLECDHTLVTGTWYFVTFVDLVDAGQAYHWYLNSQECSYVASTVHDYVDRTDTANNYYIASGYNPYFDGTIDEVRISNIVRSDQDIATEYNNQSAVSEFITFGAEESIVPSITSVTDSPDPAQHSSTITFSVDWNDDIDPSENVKVKICKTDSLTGQNCDGGHYASSTAFTTSDPETATYIVQADDVGAKDYYAFVCNDDGNCSGSTHGAFTIRTTQVNTPYTNSGRWYNANWKYRRAITLQSSQISTTTDSFAVLATTTLSDLKSYAHDGHVGNSDGYDIVFTDSDGETLLNYEREKFDSDTGEMVYWINTDISSTTDKVVYMYYGNASASDLATTTGVWDDEYVMVNHLAHDGVATTTYPDFLDSTKYNNDGSSVLMNSDDLVDGQANGALDFDGVDDYVDAGSGSSLNLNKSLTLSAWVNPDEEQNTYILAKRSDVANGYNIILMPGSALKTVDGGGSVVDSGFTLDSNVWQHVVIVINSDGTGVTFYRNTVSSGEKAMTAHPDSPTQKLFIGSRNGGALPFDGTIDEVRISNIARSAQDIATEYNNQSAVSEFMTFGAEESLNRVTIVNAPTTYRLNDGLVGNWTFNGQDMDWSSTTAEALDRSGNSNNGNVVNGATPVIGISGQALDFDGVDDYILVGDNDSLDGHTSMSWSFWVNISSDGNNKKIINKYTGSSGKRSYYIYIKSNEDLTLLVSSNGSNYEFKTAQTNLLLNQWYHIVVVFDGGVFDTYVDGSVVSDDGDFSTHTSIYAGSDNLQISGSGVTSLLSGLIDEVRVYDRALSVDEVGELYRAGARRFKIKN